VTRWVALAGVALTLTACGSSASSEHGTAAPAKTATPRSTPAAPQHTIHVRYDQPRNKGEAIAEEILKDGGVDGIAAGFSKNFKLPVDLTIHATHGDGSPFYNPDTKTVTLYYGFTEAVDRILEAGDPGISQHELGTEWAAVDDFILIHELGHAFVDVFALPITGREEDAVDGMATVFLTSSVDNGAEYAFDAARFFRLLQQVQGVPDAQQFQDEHSLSVQRSYDIACSVAGSSPTTMRQIARLKILSPRRLQRCPAEYQQKSRAWKILLKPHLRTG
jgi:hypothetical protein